MTLLYKLQKNIGKLRFVWLSAQTETFTNVCAFKPGARKSVSVAQLRLKLQKEEKMDFSENEAELSGWASHVSDNLAWLMVVYHCIA